MNSQDKNSKRRRGSEILRLDNRPTEVIIAEQSDEIADLKAEIERLKEEVARLEGVIGNALC